MNLGPWARAALAAEVGLLLFQLYCGWRLRALRRPDAPAWKFLASPQRSEPDLYTAAGQVWLQRAGAATAASVVGFFVLGGLVVAGL